MGNTICSCNNAPDKELNMFPHVSDQDKKDEMLQNYSKARRGPPTEQIGTNMVTFMYFLKLQRAVRRFLVFKQKTKGNKEAYGQNEIGGGTGGGQIFKRSGFDDKNYTYNGEYENGNKQGFGIQTWKDGAIYRGYFYENKANFIGLFEHSDGDIYQGEFKDDRACGHGFYQHANGASYEGLWIDDTQHGIGIEIWTDKSEYKGEYFRGKKSGIGSYQWADGSSYEGEWYDNTLHGFVSLNYNLIFFYIIQSNF